MNAGERERPLSFEELTVGCSDAGVLVGPGRWPRVCAPEPVTMPEVPENPAGAHEPLVSVTAGGSRVRSLDAYRRCGWEHSTRDQVARAGVVAALHDACAALGGPYGLAVFDAWRPPALQRGLYDAAYTGTDLDAGYVSEPSTDPRTPPPHITGGAIDCTLTWDGKPLALGTHFDAFCPSAAAESLEPGDSIEAELRRMLVAVMRTAGFEPLDAEWWHFELGTRRWAALRGEAPLYGATAPTQ